MTQSTDFTPGLLEYQQDYGPTDTADLADQWLDALDCMAMAVKPGTPVHTTLYTLRDNVAASLAEVLALHQSRGE